MSTNQNIIRAKLDVRIRSKDLIKCIFEISALFPENDPHNFRVEARKKVLSISSNLSHATVRSDKAEQGEGFLYVMSELKEVLKIISLTHHFKFINDRQKQYARLAISNTIIALDELVKLLGSFDGPDFSN